MTLTMSLVFWTDSVRFQFAQFILPYQPSYANIIGMLSKIGHVADYEGRSVNSHVLVLIRESIQAFESSHDPIGESIRPDVNVKPAGKRK